LKNYYKILNIEKKASSLAIKKAYRKQAKKLHPDVNYSKNAHNDFLEINEAYNVLNNPIKRVQYDRLYDYQILKKAPKNQKKYTNKHTKWETHVNKSAEKGEKKGADFAKENETKFNKRVRKWEKIWDSDTLSFIFDVLIDGVLRVILEVIFTL